MKRLFIGIFIPPKVLNKQYPRLKKEFGGIIPGKWVKTENLHITLKFLGYVDNNKIKQINHSLKEIFNNPLQEPIELSGLGVFPNPKNPRILYINVKDNSNFLQELHQSIEKKMLNLGFEKERKPFKPHITIKRIKTDIDTEKFIPKLTKYKDFYFGKLESVEINLIESITLPSGAIYHKI
ncbi:MAG: RNA 2',3'-cyclic phosphodiesterase [Aquificae bacterium]|nr:RNA 2',3'-cyclic phosphodiesterase [Aquificota bacterium]